MIVYEVENKCFRGVHALHSMGYGTRMQPACWKKNRGAKVMQILTKVGEVLN